MDILFYGVSALFIAVVFSYGIFSAKAYLQKKAVKEIDGKIAFYGSPEQKDIEKKVLVYKKTIDDYVLLASGHKISSSVFSFIEQRTLPEIWFDHFSLSQASGEARLSGEAQNMEFLSRQTAVFERETDYIKSISVLNSQISPAGKVKFILNLALESGIFNHGGQ